MRLKKRILLAIILCLLLPLLLIAVVVWLILHFQVQLISMSYNVNTNKIEILQNSPALFESLVEDDFNELLVQRKEDADLFTDESWLASKNAELAGKYSFLILRVVRDIRYVGDNEKYASLKDQLPAFVGNEENDGKSIFLEGESHVLMRQIDFRTYDGREATLFLITDINHVLPQFRRTLIEAMIALFIALVLTTVIVVTWLYRSIVRPLKEIGRAANEIAEGNLDCSLPEGKKDEIGQLQGDFEAMRVHLKAMSESELKYQQESREMVANISHDLKTPLTAIRGYAEGLLDGVADTPEKQERYFRTIYNKAGDMERMVEEIAYYAKIEQQSMPYDFRKMDLHAFLADCIEEQSLDLEQQGITLLYEANCPEGATAVFDPEHIKRVLINIIGNSVKYMDKEPGRITVGLNEADEFFEVSVTDNGCGIPEADIPRIFERFYRGDSARGTKRGGSGIGLAIVKTIIGAHGGSVSAESEQGEGTTIRFTLPKQLLDTAPEEASEVVETGGRKWKRRRNASS